MGGVRFTIGALIRIADLRYYRARIKFLPASWQTRNFCGLRDDNCSNCLSKSQRQSLLSDPDYIPDPDNRPDTDGPGWQSFEGELITVMGCNVSWISYDVHIAPFSHLSDGLIDLFIIKKCTRSQLLSVFADLETGAFVNSALFNTGELIEYHKVQAFSIEPLGSNKGVFGLDGEKSSSSDPIFCRSIRGATSICTF